jgi:uncharacterized protein YndB with AHSA1/START domain
MARSHETITQLAASPEAVWKAITDAEEIARWFAPEVRVEPGPGGSIYFSWGPEAQGKMLIETWEPNQRLRVTENNIIIEYFIEAKDGLTTLRLVHSGFGDGTEWDGEYEGTKTGWPVFFRILKHNLEQHPGEPVRQISITLPVDASPDEQWARLLGGQVDHLTAGAHYSLDLPMGDHLEGTIDHTDRRHVLAAVVQNWNRALLTVFCERAKEQGLLTVNLAVYGPTIARADEIEARWRQALKELFVCTPSS